MRDLDDGIGPCDEDIAQSRPATWGNCTAIAIARPHPGPTAGRRSHASCSRPPPSRRVPSASCSPPPPPLHVLPYPPQRPFGNCRIARFSRGPELHPPFARRERSERASSAIFTLRSPYFRSNSTTDSPPSSPLPSAFLPLPSLPLPLPSPRAGRGRAGRRGQRCTPRTGHRTSPRRPSPPRSRGSSRPFRARNSSKCAASDRQLLSSLALEYTHLASWCYPARSR